MQGAPFDRTLVSTNLEGGVGFRMKRRGMGLWVVLSKLRTAGATRKTLMLAGENILREIHPPRILSGGWA